MKVFDIYAIAVTAGLVVYNGLPGIDLDGVLFLCSSAKSKKKSFWFIYYSIIFSIILVSLSHSGRTFLSLMWLRLSSRKIEFEQNIKYWYL